MLFKLVGESSVLIAAIESVNSERNPVMFAVWRAINSLRWASVATTAFEAGIVAGLGVDTTNRAGKTNDVVRNLEKCISVE
jgi:hypothetical protein